MNIEAVIFDLDGVIVSTDDCHYKAWKQMADDENIYFDRVINNRLRGVSRMASLEIILEKATKSYTDAEKLQLTEKKNKIYVELIKQLTPNAMVPGVMDNLEELKKNEIKLAIGSSSKNTPVILERIGLDSFFDAVSDGNNISKSKPAPEVFVKSVAMLGIDYDKCAIVEDADAGILAGKNAGMLTVSVNGAKGADCFTKSLSDGSLLELIKKHSAPSDKA